MDTKAYEFLEIDVRDGVAFTTFNRPEAANKWAYSQEWEMSQFFDDAIADDDIRVVLFTGKGDAFCGGADHSDDPFDAYGYYERSCTIFRKWMDIDKPLVMAINGTAGGSGLTLAMFGDVVIAERQVEFRDAHVLGGVVTATGPFLWPPNMGLLRAKRYLLTGDPFSAEEAERFGLVNEVVDKGESLTRATAIAKQLASIRPEAVQGTKRALNQWQRQSFGPIFEHALSLEFMRFPGGLYQ
jgi:enoyl-CoA hydratase